MPEPALVAVDESTSEHYVTAGAVHLEAANIPFVLAALSDFKAHYGIPVDAEIHCRELFAGDKRRKGAFKGLKANALIPFLSECVVRTRLAGCSWFTTHCDSSMYPKIFIMFEGNSDFKVKHKHIAGLLVGACAQMVSTVRGDNFQLIFDKDSTKLDWGMAKRMQATTFVANSPNAIALKPEYKPFLELADIAAYVHGREVSSRSQPENRKLTRFAAVSRAMQAHSSTFAWIPPELEGRPELWPS